jgi:hypothetical protein
MSTRLLTTALLLSLPLTARAEGRAVRPLDGPWQFRRDGADAWKGVPVPSTFQSHEGSDWHGVGWYRKTLDSITIPAGHRLLLHFDAAATRAEVWWNDTKLGEHLGGWTPFRFDVTEAVRQAGPQAKHTIRVKVDEKVGHNTDGFLPAIQPHYGGLWQGVRLITVPDVYIDDLRLHAWANPDTGRLDVVFDLAGRADASVPLDNVTLRWRPPGQRDWSMPPDNRIDNGRVEGRVIGTYEAGPTGAGITRPGGVVLTPPDGLKPWSPEQPNLYEIELTVKPAGPNAVADRVTVRTGARSFVTKGDQFLLNGHPLTVRGVLNWGYYPPILAPNPAEGVWREDLRRIKSWGFNLMKCCLWLPPQRLLEIADEEGVLIWMEYPTWHPKVTPATLPELRQEFDEFFRHDRNHPSVILRSLTCETGQTGVPFEVIKGLYDRCKELVPGAVVEDDSSWVEWGRVRDFYDDHAYGNNHTWPKTLQRLRDYAHDNGLKAKPILLGEAIAADTWTPHDLKAGTPHPYWVPGFYEANQAWLEKMRRIAGPVDEGLFQRESKRYAMLMRKYQIETFREELPKGGYVVAGLRDFPLAAMGLIHYSGEPKWKPGDWYWHGDRMFLIRTAYDRRSFSTREPITVGLTLARSSPGQPEKVRFRVVLKQTDNARVEVLEDAAGTPRGDRAQNLGLFHHYPGSFEEVHRPLTAPTRFEFSAAVTEPIGAAVANSWPLWVLPLPPAGGLPTIVKHSSFPADLARYLFATYHTIPDAPPDGVIVTCRLDEQLLASLEAGGKVLLLPDGRPGSFPLKSHWFLRGGPFVADHPALTNVPRQLLIETQAFDLAGDVIPDLYYLEEIDPIVMLWENHDIKQVMTHGLVFETKVGKGRLLVSALNHAGSSNAVGQYLFAEFLKHLATGPAPKHALSDQTLRRLREKLQGRTIDLTPLVWKFQPDPDNKGLDRGWHKPTLKHDESWKDIRIGKNWESQGYPNLDGWAWYRLDVTVPADWAGREVFVNFGGADDYYELYVNGTRAGSGGDLEKRITALDEAKGHRVTNLVKPGAVCTIAVRVYDWYGAGGISRPMTLDTTGLIVGRDVMIR